MNCKGKRNSNVKATRFVLNFDQSCMSIGNLFVCHNVGVIYIKTSKKKLNELLVFRAVFRAVVIQQALKCDIKKPYRPQECGFK